MDCSTPPVRCDWLDLTYPTGSPLGDGVCDFLSDRRCLAKRVSDNVLEFRLPEAAWGNIQLGDSSRGWSRLSASGGSLEALRCISSFDDYLTLIGGYPHTLTRLDACMDLAVPAPPVITALLSKYPPDSLVYLTRKGVRPAYNLQPSLDGGFTGTFYAGPLRYGKSKSSARVYDKRAEVLERTGQDIGPLVRYEVTARKGVGMTLRDAQGPSALFWHIAAPALLNAPANTPAWIPFDGDTWSPGVVVLDDYRRLQNRVEQSVDLESMLDLADKLKGDGRTHLLRMIRSRLGLREIAIA